MITVYTASYERTANEKKRKVEHELGLFLLQTGLKERYDLLLNIEELQAEIMTGEHGKPCFKTHTDIHFNISHTEGLVVCVLSDKPVGIDVERIHEFKDSLPRRVLTEKEQEFLFGYKENIEVYRELFFRFWTLKESYLKWDGSGFSKEPDCISFALDLKKDPVGISYWDKEDNRKVSFYQEKINDRYFLAVCGMQLPEHIKLNKMNIKEE